MHRRHLLGQISEINENYNDEYVNEEDDDFIIPSSACNRTNDQLNNTGFKSNATSYGNFINNNSINPNTFIRNHQCPSSQYSNVNFSMFNNNNPVDRLTESFLTSQKENLYEAANYNTNRNSSDIELWEQSNMITTYQDLEQLYSKPRSVWLANNQLTKNNINNNNYNTSGTNFTRDYLKTDIHDSEILL